MSAIFNLIRKHANFWGGDSGPAGMIEKRYMTRHLPPRGVVLDLGGGEGRLARDIATPLRRVIVLDREQTCLPGADNSIYQGSLNRLLRQRGDLPIIPLRGDATAFPLADASVDAIVSCQLLEHLEPQSRVSLFRECARCLRPGGMAVISTPDGEIFGRRNFWVSKLARRIIPEHRRSGVPASLRGPWLLQSVEDWESKVGHFDHGCRADELARDAEAAGLIERNRRASETGLTAIWLEIAGTLPLLAMAAAPLVRALYELEWRLPPTRGINLLMTFQKPLEEGK